MATCFNFAVQTTDDDGRGFGSGTKSVSIISNSWRRLQIRCKKRGLLMSGALENRSSSFDQYVMLEDDGYEESVGAYHENHEFEIDTSDDTKFIPQWSATMIEPQFEATKDSCSSDSSDDSTDENGPDTTNSMHQKVFDERIGAFPITSEVVTDGTTNPPMSMDDVEEICGITFLRPGSNNRRKIYRTGGKKITETRQASDSETDEDSSSTSSIQDDKGLITGNDTPSTEVENGRNVDQRRSIRFSDEVLGQSLATIHFVPWSEHEDPEWIPRPVRCRIEL